MGKWLAIWGMLVLPFGAGATAADDAAPALRIGGLDIPGVFSLQEAGPYHDLYDELASESPVKSSLHMLPVKRATRAFFEHEVDCLYMLSDDEDFFRANGHSYAEFVGSLPFNHLYMRAFTPAKKPVVHNSAALSGLILASDEGTQQSTIAQRSLPAGQRILYTKTLDEAFDLVDSGRAGAVLAYDFDVQRYLERKGRSDYRVSQDFALLSLTEQYVCWPTAEARSFVRYLDGRISNMKVSGVLKKTYGFVP